MIISVSGGLLLFFAGLHLLNLPSWFPPKHSLLGFFITLHILYWIGRGIVVRRNCPLCERGSFDLSDWRAVSILFFFTALMLVWFGFVVFKNPYLYVYNHGNGAYFCQLLHNISQRVGPEHTVKFNGALYFHANPYFYASAFAVVPQILPLLVLPPLYSLYPQPPMHVYSIILVVVLAGSFGTYLAIRALGGSPFLSLLGATGYCLLPWVELPIFMMGFFDTLGFALYPYVFAALFAKKWHFFYAGIVLLALLNVPYAYSVIALGLITVFFFRAPRHGIAAIVIGFLILQGDILVIKESLAGIWDLEKQPSGSLLQIFREYDLNALKKASLFHIQYLLMLLMTMAFLPLAGIRKEGRWNWPIIGLLIFAGIGAVMGLYRSYDLASHRNANMVVPIYLCAFMTYLNFRGNAGVQILEGKAQTRSSHVLLGVLLSASIVSACFWFSSHYPWSPLMGRHSPMTLVKTSAINSQYENVLSKLNQYIPENASVAYRIDSAIQAFITNRQKAWYLGYHPEGVEYYFIQTREVEYIDPNLPLWKEHLAKVEADKRNKLLYRDEGLVIYKNLEPKPIPRLEAVLGWGILIKALVPGKWSF